MFVTARIFFFFFFEKSFYPTNYYEREGFPFLPRKTASRTFDRSLGHSFNPLARSSILGMKANRMTTISGRDGSFPFRDYVLCYDEPLTTLLPALSSFIERSWLSSVKRNSSHCSLSLALVPNIPRFNPFLHLLLVPLLSLLDSRSISPGNFNITDRQIFRLDFIPRTCSKVAQKSYR